MTTLPLTRRWPGNHLGDVGMEIEQLCRVTVPDVIEGGSTTDLRLHADVLERIAVLVDEARRQMGEVSA